MNLLYYNCTREVAGGREIAEFSLLYHPNFMRVYSQPWNAGSKNKHKTGFLHKLHFNSNQLSLK